MSSFPHSMQSLSNSEYSDTIDAKKRMVREEFTLYHHQLTAKEEQICNQLEGVAISESDKFHGSLQPTDDMINFLTSQVEELQSRFEEKNMLHYVETYLTGMQQFLEDKKRLEQSPPILSVKIKFDRNFSDLVDRLCTIEQISVFRYDPYPVKYRHKQTPNESVEALAIDTETNKIFALVKGTVSSVKVFNGVDLVEENCFVDQKIMFQTT